MAKKGPKASKNNIENRGAAAKVKEINGQPLKVVMLKSREGSFMVGVLPDGKIVSDSMGKPIPYSKIVTQ